MKLYPSVSNVGHAAPVYLRHLFPIQRNESRLEYACDTQCVVGFRVPVRSASPGFGDSVGVS